MVSKRFVAICLFACIMGLQIGAWVTGWLHPAMVQVKTDRSIMDDILDPVYVPAPCGKWPDRVLDIVMPGSWLGCQWGMLMRTHL